jgi:hypothetical protein
MLAKLVPDINCINVRKYRKRVLFPKKAGHSDDDRISYPNDSEFGAVKIGTNAESLRKVLLHLLFERNRLAESNFPGSAGFFLQCLDKVAVCNTQIRR